MDYFSEAWQQLKQRLAVEFPDTPGMQCINLSIPVSLKLSLLEWLDAQTLYPKFYWLHRDGREEIAVCGQICGFNDASAACAYLQQYAQPQARIWGVNAFDSRDTEGGVQANWLFLPRLELVRRGRAVSLHLYLADEKSLQQDAERAKEWLRQVLAPQPLPSLQIQVKEIAHFPDYAAWCRLLTEALESIARGNIEKVVLARQTTLNLNSPLSAASFLAASRRVNHRCFHFMLARHADQVFLGSSPERLYHRQGRVLSTEALAGTVVNTEDDTQAQWMADWLIKDSKNQHENLLVVEDICQRLQGAVLGVDVMPLEVLRLRKVQHLRRAIRCQLHVADDGECLRRLQPTAAVAGLPRQTARQFILHHEPFHRGWYTGSVGYLSLQQAEFVVALRVALVEKQQVHIYAGAGIVAGSNPDEEWQEVENKAAGLRTLLEGSQHIPMVKQR